MTGASDLVKLLTHDCSNLTGGMLNVETDPVKAIDGMPAHIVAKRKRLRL